jgi:hypothetical protein
MAEIDSRKASLIAEIEVSRGELRKALQQCEASLNPAAILRKSVREHSLAWLSSSALAGLVLSQILRLRLGRPSPPKAAPPPEDAGAPWTGNAGGPRGRGWVSGLGRFAFDLLRPVLADWAAEQLAHLVRSMSPGRNPLEGNGARYTSGRKGPDSATSGRSHSTG